MLGRIVSARSKRPDTNTLKALKDYTVPGNSKAI